MPVMTAISHDTNEINGWYKDWCDGARKLYEVTTNGVQFLVATACRLQGKPMVSTVLLGHCSLYTATRY